MLNLLRSVGGSIWTKAAAFFSKAALPAAATVGGTIAVDQMTKDVVLGENGQPLLDEKGNPIRRGIVGRTLAGGVTQTAEDAARPVAAGQGVLDDNERSSRAQDDVRKIEVDAAQQSASVQGGHKQTQIHRQDSTLQGLTSKANFWTGTLGSFLHDVVNQFFPGTWLASWMDSQVNEARDIQKDIAKKIDTPSNITPTEHTRRIEVQTVTTTNDHDVAAATAEVRAQEHEPKTPDQRRVELQQNTGDLIQAQNARQHAQAPVKPGVSRQAAAVLDYEPAAP